MMKKIYLFAALLLAVSCQESIIERRVDGCLSLRLENSPAMEVVTKGDAGAEALSTDDFNVYVSSALSTYSYIYKSMPDVITLPVGTYVVSADNVSEEESVSQPDIWGQVRYAGQSDPVEVVAGLNPAYVTLTCTMANTAVSVTFGENIDKHFTDYTITAYTSSDRKLVFTPSNTAGDDAVVAYYPATTLNYAFSGKYLQEQEPMTITGSLSLEAATHLHLTFRMSEQNGAVGKPTIILVEDCKDLYETITVDPTGNGSFVIE